MSELQSALLLKKQLTGEYPVPARPSSSRRVSDDHGPPRTRTFDGGVKDSGTSYHESRFTETSRKCSSCVFRVGSCLSFSAFFPSGAACRPHVPSGFSSLVDDCRFSIGFWKLPERNLVVCHNHIGTIAYLFDRGQKRPCVLPEMLTKIFFFQNCTRTR